MLKRLRLVNFKSFVDEKIELDPLTLLVGAHAAGKSNILDAMRFLQGVGLDMSFADILRGRWEGGRQLWPGIRGGAPDIVLRGAAELTIESEWQFDDETISHAISCRAGDRPLLSHESLKSSAASGDLFDIGSATHPTSKDDIRVDLEGTGTGNRKPQVYTLNRSLLSQIKASPASTEEMARVCGLLTGAMRGAYFLDITPSCMRDYAPRHMTELGLEGENVSALAWTICQDPDAKADLVDWLTELCAPDLVDIDFAKTDLGEVMLVLVETGGRRIPARSLSDGTLRFLGQLLALRTAPAGSLLLIEEIENGLHPTRAHLLVEAMETATTARQVQVIATTHSPLVLNALSPEALRKTVLVARPPDSPGSVLRHLQDLPDFDAVCERRGVDRMITSGWLETVGKGRKRAMRDMGAAWTGMLTVCPEIARLRDDIRALLETPQP